MKCAHFAIDYFRNPTERVSREVSVAMAVKIYSRDPDLCVL